MAAFSGCGGSRSAADRCPPSKAQPPEYASLSWSPSGKIAFADDLSGRLLVLEPRTRQVVTLACGGDPAWSPDGSRLAFAHDGHVYVADASARHARRITGRGWYRGPVWDADGKRLTLTVEGDYIASLVSIGADGRDERSLPVGPRPSPSPDGKWTVFAGEHAVVVARRGSRAKTVWRGRGPYDAFWSPGGEQIAFRDIEGRVWTLRANGVPRRLRNVRSDASLAWSPDGKRLAFISNVFPCPGVFVIPAGGGAARRLTPDCD